MLRPLLLSPGQQAAESTAASTVSLASTGSSQNTVESAPLENGDEPGQRESEGGAAETNGRPAGGRLAGHSRSVPAG